jgi:hypothetical protein
MIMLTDDDQCRSITVSATRLLSGLVDVKRNDDDALPPVVYGVAARTRALDDETGERTHEFPLIRELGSRCTAPGRRSTESPSPSSSLSRGALPRSLL